MENYIDQVGMIAAILGTIALFPQVIKTIKTRHTKDLSIVMYTLSTIAVLMWLIYGLATNDKPLIFANAISFLSTSTILVIICINIIKEKKGTIWKKN